MALSLRARRVVAAATASAYLVQPLGALAQLAADPNAARRPVVDAAPNGVPLVHIIAPSAAGVSRNTYQQFNVDARGLVLNNSTTAVSTQLAGAVPGNAQLGAPARVILNEVTGGAATALRGYTEIAGSRAEVVIANANGITCAGCGFINASRGVLTTGTPVFGSAGSLDAFDVRRGMVSFEGAGLDARNVDRVDVLARAIAVNAELWARDLNLVTGANRVDYASLGATPIAGDGPAPAFALDVAAIGGMYADRIRLVGTEAGLGVNMRGAMQAQTGALTLTADGRLVNTGRLDAAADASISASTGVENRGTVRALGGVSMSSAGTVTNTGVVAGGGDVVIQGASIDGAGTLAAGVDVAGAVSGAGTVRLDASGAVSVGGAILAGGTGVRVAAASADVSGARIAAGRDVAINATTGDVDARGAAVDAGERLTLSAAGTLRNDAATLSGGSVDVRAAALNNRAGLIVSRGAANVEAARLDNRGGRVVAQGHLSIAAADALDNSAGGRIGAGGDASLRAGAVLNDSGDVAANRGLSVTATSVSGAGRVAAGADLALDVAVDFANAANAALTAGGTLSITSPGTLRNEGRIDGGAVRTRSATLANTAAIIGGRIDVAAEDVTNTGAAAVIGGVDDVQVLARRSLANTDGALIYSGGNLAIAGGAGGARTPSVLNEGSTIEAAGAVAIAAEALVNRRRDVSIATDTLSASSTLYQVWDSSWSLAVIGDPGYSPLIIRPADALPFERQRTVASTVTEDRVTAASPPAQILAGTSISLDAGTVENHASRISAAGSALVSGTVLNRGYTLSRTSTETTTHSLCGDIQGASPGNLGNCASGWVPVDTTAFAAVPVGALPATIEGAAAITVVGPAVRNVALGANGAPAAALVTTSLPGTGGSSSAGPAGAAALLTAPITLPANGLFRVRTDAGAGYLVETDPRFTSLGQFASSEHMLAQLVFDASVTQMRLGDAFYETRVVREEIFQLTGRRFLAGYTSDYEMFIALMDAGVAAQKRLALRAGIALSNAEVAALTSDIVWPVERDVTLPDGSTRKALVPIVYLSRVTARDLDRSGALIAADDIDLRTFGDLANSGSILGSARLAIEAATVTNIGGTLSSRGLTSLAARDDIVNRSGTIGGEAIRATAGRDVVNETLAGGIAGTNSTQTAFGAQGRIAAAGDVEIAAGRDVVVGGAAVESAAGRVAIAGSRDVVVDTVAARERLGTFDVGDHVGLERERNAGSSLTAASSLTLSAGRNAMVTGSGVRAGGELGIVAGNDVTLNAAADREAFTYQARGPGWFAQATSDQQRVLGARVEAGGDVVIAAGAASAAASPAAMPRAPSSGDLLVLGSVVRSDNGTISLGAANDVIIGSAAQRQVSQSQQSRSSRGFLSSQSTDITERLDAVTQVGSVISAQDVVVSAGHDVAVRGSVVVGSGDISLQAGRNVDVVGTENRVVSAYSQTERRSGLMGSTGGGAVGFTIGSQTQTGVVTQEATSNVASTVGTAGGRMAIAAGSDYRQRGSDVVGAQGVDIAASNVAIEAVYDTLSRDEQQSFKRSGLTVSLQGAVVTSLVLARDAAMRAGDVEDPRLAAVYAWRAGRNVLNAVDQALQRAGKPSTDAFQVSVGIGSTRSESETRTAAVASVASNVSSGGDVVIRADGAGPSGGGDVSVTGSTIQGRNVVLDAARDLVLQSARDSTSLQSTQSTSNASFGVTFGAGGYGVFVQGGRASGIEGGQSVVHRETTVTATNAVGLASGRDTTLAGAIVSGESVAAIVGRNLLLQSEQDLSTYDSRSSQASAGATIGLSGRMASGGGISASTSRIDSDYASVVEQTAIRAGSGGFDISVGENTRLVGAAIDSAASPDRNRLSTGTLSFSDIANTAQYSSSTLGGAVSVSPGRTPIPVPIIGTGGATSEQGTTVAAVAPGTLEIRNPQTQTQDVAALSRNPATANQALEQIFNKKTVQEQQELATVFGQEAFFVVGEIGSAKLQEATALRRVANSPQTSESDRVALLNRATLIESQWNEGGAYRTLLHGLVGAFQASLGGASAAAGAAGASASAAVLAAFDQSLQAAGVSPEARPALLAIASTAIGGAVALLAGDAQAGAATALTGTTYNFLLHRQDEERKAALAACERTSAPSACTTEQVAHFKALSEANTAAVRDCVGFDACSTLAGQADAERKYLERALASCTTSECKTYYENEAQDATIASLMGMRRRSDGGWAADLAVDAAGLGSLGLAAAIGSTGLRTSRTVHTATENYDVGKSFEVYVIEKRLRGVEDAGQLRLEEHFATPDLALQYVKPDFTIRNRAGGLVALGDAKTGDKIVFDEQARGLIRWASESSSRTLIYYTPLGLTPIAPELFIYAQRNGVRVIQIGVP